MKKKKLEQKLTKTKKKLVKAKSRVAELESKVERTNKPRTAAAARPRPETKPRASSTKQTGVKNAGLALALGGEDGNQSDK